MNRGILFVVGVVLIAASPGMAMAQAQYQPREAFKAAESQDARQGDRYRSTGRYLPRAELTCEARFGDNMCAVDRCEVVRSEATEESDRLHRLQDDERNWREASLDALDVGEDEKDESDDPFAGYTLARCDNVFWADEDADIYCECAEAVTHVEVRPDPRPTTELIGTPRRECSSPRTLVEILRCHIEALRRVNRG